MTRDDIIRMASEAGFDDFFAALIAADKDATIKRLRQEIKDAHELGIQLAIAAEKHEREACAKVCVEIAERDFWCVGDILTAIRARGEKP